MRIELPARVDKCRMCGREARDASGQWFVIKAHSLYFPFGWLPWGRLQDIGMVSLTMAWLLCENHAASNHTIHVIDGR